MISTPSRAIARARWLSTLLGDAVQWRPLVAGGAAVVGWGRKTSYWRARRLAERAGLPVWALEDGFLRSVGFGRGEPSLSLVVDDIGIYYDAVEPSRLERLISGGPFDELRAGAIIAAWRAARVSKYNHAREFSGALPQSYVLVADQTRGDASIGCGLADGRSFARMLDAALIEHPDAVVVLKTHPEVMAGRKQGHFDLKSLAANPRVMVLGEDVHPAGLIEGAAAVYTVTSQIGFEALLWGRPVRVFGMPFYGGFGLTQDELPAPARRLPVSLECLVYAALVGYSRYVDPETGMRCEVERVIEHLRLQRDRRLLLPEEVWGIGFSLWKRRILPRFLAGSRLHFVRRANAVPAGAAVAIWGNRPLPETGNRVLRIEDGFLRSVGLGADLVQPLSWVVDDLGIYYDASRPSRLERILSETPFDQQLLRRAAALRQDICRLSLTKYNVRGVPWRRPPGVDCVILVAGQVESDASISLGAPGMRRNLDLLRAARAANPYAYLVYKPHPDVVAGLRAAGMGEDAATTSCDEVVVDCPMGDLLDEVDEVHVLTSLSGFEALLRGKRVACYGLPFYAGWGLTVDHCPAPRRTRRLLLDELVAGCLILYPSYVSRQSGAFTSPENTLHELQAWREASRGGESLWQAAFQMIWRGLRKNGLIG